MKINQNLFRMIALAAAGLLLASCSGNILPESKKIEYKSAGKLPSLEVPPDLTQPTRDERYAVPDISPKGSATYSEYAGERVSGATSTAAAVLPSVDKMRIERAGSQRWLVATGTPDQMWTTLKDFWQELGFIIDLEMPEAGVMETDWAENRAKIPLDTIRRTIGRALDSLYSTPERDKFRTRIERTAGGSEVYISHRGMMEIYVNELKDRTVWQPRPSDPELEAEFLSRLMVKLGAKEDTARTAVAAAAPAAPNTASTPAKARASALPAIAALEIDDSFERAWRQVGLALDRSGFTVEDRDRSAGLYFVRYIDPKLAGKEEPNFFSKLFSGDKDAARPQRVRVLVKAAGNKSMVTVQTGDGVADNSEQARTIIGKLMDQMK